MNKVQLKSINSEITSIRPKYLLIHEKTIVTIKGVGFGNDKSTIDINIEGISCLIITI